MLTESRRYWVTSSEVNPAPPSWTHVHVRKHLHSVGGLQADVCEWMDSHGVSGEYAYADAYVGEYHHPRQTEGEIWAFSDPDTAMLFKIRWA